MMRKYPRKTGFNFNVGSILKAAVALELIVFAGSYLCWNQMNKSRSFRKQMQNNFPLVLSGYYYIGEYLNPNDTTRLMDSSHWEAEDQQILKD